MSSKGMAFDGCRHSTLGGWRDKLRTRLTTRARAHLSCSSSQSTGSARLAFMTSVKQV